MYISIEFWYLALWKIWKQYCMKKRNTYLVHFSNIFVTTKTQSSILEHLHSTKWGSNNGTSLNLATSQVPIHIAQYKIKPRYIIIK